MDLQHGFLLFFIGCSSTFIGFFMAFLVINYNQKKKNKKRVKGPMDDLLKDMPGSKAGDDCQ